MINNTTKEKVNQLLNDLKNGYDTIGELYNLIGGYLRFVVFKFISNEHDVSDILQKFWMELPIRIKSCLVFTNSFRYICKMLENQIYDFMRSNKKDKLIVDLESVATIEDVSLNPEKNSEETELNEALKRSIISLPCDERMVIINLFYQNMTIRFLSESFDIPKSKIMRLKVKGLDLLKRMMKDEGFDIDAL